jgi:hypothetical protein
MHKIYILVRYRSSFCNELSGTKIHILFKIDSTFTDLSISQVLTIKIKVTPMMNLGIINFFI